MISKITQNSYWKKKKKKKKKKKNLGVQGFYVSHSAKGFLFIYFFSEREMTKMS